MKEDPNMPAHDLPPGHPPPAGRLLVALCRLHGRLSRRLRWCLNPRRARLQARAHGGDLTLAHGCRLDVPLRCDGPGCVRIGRGVNLGFARGPRAGTGEILLQARRPEAVIELGDRTGTGNNIMIIANQRITVGRDCIIGDSVSIYDSDFHAVRRGDRARSTGGMAPVEIRDGVWLGSRVMVLKGVRIGENTVVGAGSVVTRTLPANVVAAGVPARVLHPV